MQNISFETVTVNGVSLHTALAGPEEGPLVVLLHGFPEFWYEWRHLIGPLAARGYRVAAPDQRGYNQSGKPLEIEAYALDELRNDVTELIKAMGREKAVIIGHDWGGAVGWYTAASRPEYVEKFIAINIPHLPAMPASMKKDPTQLLRSSYMLFFQLPRLPEKLLAYNDFEEFANGLVKTSRPGSFTEEDLERYKEAWSQPNAVTTMINWYRAMRKGPKDIVESSHVTPPVRIIWGVGDAFLSKASARTSLEYCRSGELIFVSDATHWVVHEQPEIVERLVTEFIEQT